MSVTLQLNGWDVAGAIAQYGEKVSATMAQSLQNLANTLQQQAQTAAQRAALAQAAWQTLDQMSSAALAELNAIQAGSVDAQTMARVEAMKNALGHAETFAYQFAASDDTALGGDLAYYYGLSGSLSGMNTSAAQDVLGAAAFGSSAQTLRPFTGISGGPATLS
jgi:hypothetical protein